MKSETKPKLCKDCLHHGIVGGYHICTRSELGIDLVTGDPIHGGCVNEREGLGTCGKDGKFFEPIGKPPF